MQFSYLPVRGEQDWIHLGSSLGRWVHCKTRNRHFTAFPTVGVKSQSWEVSKRFEIRRRIHPDDAHFEKQMTVIFTRSPENDKEEKKFKMGKNQTKRRHPQAAAFSCFVFLLCICRISVCLPFLYYTVQQRVYVCLKLIRRDSMRSERCTSHSCWMRDYLSHYRAHYNHYLRQTHTLVYQTNNQWVTDDLMLTEI